MTELSNDDIRTAVREQYGKVARGEVSGCGVGCCSGGDTSLSLGYSQADLDAAGEGADLGLGCGNPQAIARLSRGETVLDLGAGGGFDCFLAAKQVGPDGRVIGVDMTADMVSRARANAERLGVGNAEFRLGEIEHLPVQDSSIDVILSNCVINLSPDKGAVFREAFRVLKPGGRLAISDVVATAVLPESLRDDMTKLTGCVSGAAQVIDLERMLREAGFGRVRVAVDAGSREVVRGWFPDSGLENYVASATLEADKPGVSGCCAPSCCDGEAAS